MGIVILGIGNILLADEGAGVHAMNLLASQLPGSLDIAYIDGGTLGFSLAEYIEKTGSLIVLDAIELHGEPGTVRTFTGRAMDRFLGAAKRSAHDVALLDLLDIARLTDTLPKHRALVGIQPQIIDWGLKPSRAVHNALPVAAEEATALLCQWGVISPQRRITLAQSSGC